MRSIRWSLLAYFLVLVAVALGAVAVSSYENTREILKARQASRQKLLEKQLNEDIATENQKLDAMLLVQAHHLADQVTYQYLLGNMRYAVPLAPLSLLNTGLDPNGLLLLPIWYSGERWSSEDRRGPAYEYLFRVFVSNIQFPPEDVLQRRVNSQAKLYFQCTSESGFTQRSQSMGDLTFPYDSRDFATTPLHEAKYEDIVLQPGQKLRLVTLKEAVSHQLFVPGPRRQPSAESVRPRPDVNRRDKARKPLPPPEPFERTPPAIFIQCAADTRERDESIAGLQTRLEDELGALRDESQATLGTARSTLLVIAFATFVAAAAGGFWIVRYGLLPLRRLSEAVSKVSPRDFRLPLDDAPLPAELRPIAGRLTQTLDMLKRAFAREKQASADISHELRTPLAALLTTLEVGLRKPRSTEEYREILTDCHAAGQHMSQLVERLLALARLDAGADTLRPREVDVASLAQQCAALVRPLAEARGLSLRVQRNGPIPLRADADKLREVLTNLLHNAIEYNRPNGSIDLAVEQENGDLFLNVRDTGIGIAAAQREHIFERFYRVDPSRRADSLHAGLGLAIVKGYVDLMGGDITVESKEGEGSAFCVHFPVQKMMGGQPQES
jgi:heavy metal sensor kinase